MLPEPVVAAAGVARWEPAYRRQVDLHQTMGTSAVVASSLPVLLGL
jgi:hypothetical protein